MERVSSTSVSETRGLLFLTTLKRFAKRGLNFTLFLLLSIVWLWTLGAVYYMADGGRSSVGKVAALGFVLTTVIFFSWPRLRPHILWWVLVTWALGMVWITARQPSNDRQWRIEVARIPSAELDGDMVTIRNIRNFHYRSVEDFDVSYYDKTFDLTRLDSADLLMCYWDGNTAIAHTMISFGFGGEDYVCLSVENRRQQGEAFGGIPGIYKQFEIIYIFGDDRDLINVRTSHRKEEVYLYRVQIDQEDLREYFEFALRRADKLNREPEFYDTLKYNCSSSLTQISDSLWPDQRPSRGFLSMLNGRTDEFAYGRGRLSNELPFDELKRRSYITPKGQKYQDASDFSQRVRDSLPFK